MTEAGSKDDRDDLTKAGAFSTPAGRSISMVGDRIDSRDLFIGTREIIIMHGGDAYRLRLTLQNKLILTK
jgi:hemin uptake protein HemP